MEAVTQQDLNALEARLSTSIANLLKEVRAGHGRNLSTAGDEIGGLDLAARITGLSESTLYKRTHARTIPHFRVGQRLYFKRSELEAWIEQGRRPLVSEEVEQRMAG